MNADGDLFRYRGLVAAILGAGIFIGATGVYVFHHIMQERKRRHLQQHLARLDLSVTEIQQELLSLRSSRQLSNSRQSLRSNSSRSSRLGKGNNNGYDTDAEMFSALDTEDEEFFDLSSDEEELLLRTLSENKANIKNEKAEKLFEEADILFKGNDIDRENALHLLRENEEEYNNNPDFLWRLAKAYQMQATKHGALNNKDKKKENIVKGLAHAEKALSLDLSNPDAHKWFAILTGMLGDFLTTKEKIQNGYLFQKHLATALEGKPDDPSLYHLLGRFKYEVSNLSWIEKKLAATLFAELPPVTFQDAISDFLKAEDLNPKPWKENRLLLAKCYIGENNYKEGFHWLESAKEIEPQTEDDRLCDQEIEMLVTKNEKYRK